MKKNSYAQTLGKVSVKCLSKLTAKSDDTVTKTCKEKIQDNKEQKGVTVSKVATSARCCTESQWTQ